MLTVAVLLCLFARYFQSSWRKDRWKTTGRFAQGFRAFAEFVFQYEQFEDSSITGAIQVGDNTKDMGRDHNNQLRQVKFYEQRERFWRGHMQNLFLLMETARSLCVYILVVTPHTFMEYKCYISGTMMDRLGVQGNPFIKVYDLPCPGNFDGFNYSRTHYDSFLNRTFLDQSGNVSYSALETYEEMMRPVCSPVMRFYLGGLLLFEIVAFILSLALNVNIFKYPRTFGSLLFLSAAFWGMLSFLLRYVYVDRGNRIEYGCLVTEGLVSQLHLLNNTLTLVDCLLIECLRLPSFLFGLSPTISHHQRI